MDADEPTYYVSPVAVPIASDNLRKKLLKATRKGIAEKQIKRGVKEVVKGINKGFKGLCVLAGDVSPVDVISHIPVLCEKKSIPYIYVRSRAELGVAAQTKRPTSVILLLEPKDKELKERYHELVAKVSAKNENL